MTNEIFDIKLTKIIKKYIYHKIKDNKVIEFYDDCKAYNLNNYIYLTMSIHLGHLKIYQKEIN